MRGDLVLVTGSSGFVGKRVVIELLRAGFSVRGAIRSEAKAESVRQAVIAELGEDLLYLLSFVKLDLMLDNGWVKAMLKVKAIIHTAAQVEAEEPRDPGKVIGSAVDGTERVLRYATLAGVRRVVMTSSVATIGYGHRQASGQRTYSEADFSDLAAMKRPWAHCIAKTRSERVAWAYVRNEGLELTTIHPGTILGPALDVYASASLQMVSGLLDGSISALPRCGFSIIDVRDVADMHVAALMQPKSAGERYLAASNHLRFQQIAALLSAAYPERSVTRKVIPDWMVRLSARFGGPSRQIVNDLGNEKHYAREKGEALLGRAFRSGEGAVLATAESLVRLGLIDGMSQ